MAVGLASRPENETEFPFTEADFKFLASIVYEYSGIVLNRNKMNMVYSRLVRRLRAHNLNSVAAYCALLKNNPGAEMGDFINAITTNLTRFFREEHHFEHLIAKAVPKIIARGGPKRLRIWSAGCSSGEEPYSIAMTLAEHCAEALRHWDVKILATDLDSNMVRTGTAGIYTESSTANIERRYLNKYFAVEPTSKGKVRVSDEVRRMITFKQLNLLGSWPMSGPFDVIFCRNVMIYFDGPTKTDLVHRFASVLPEDGWLYVGHSETLLDRDLPFRSKGQTIYQKVTV